MIHVELAQTGETTAEATIRQHQLVMDRPLAKGGHDAGPMGGEVLLAALGGCFMSNLLAAIQSRSADVRAVRVSVSGELAEAPSRFRHILMEVSAEHSDAALMQKLVTLSERACIVANTLRSSVELEVRVAA